MTAAASSPDPDDVTDHHAIASLGQRHDVYQSPPTCSTAGS